MTYLVLCSCFVAAAAAVAALTWRRGGPGHARVMAITAAVLVVLTAVFDTLMIRLGLFDYGDAHLTGARVGLAPVEDFAYPIAGLLLLASVWNLLDRKEPR